MGEETRSGNQAHLWRRLAWRLQAKAEGELSARARKRAGELADETALRRFWREDGSAGLGALPVRDPRLPPVGTVLKRASGGGAIDVRVMATGFDYQNQVYASLSQLAQRYRCGPPVVRDLELLYTLFIDCESLLTGVDWLRTPKWAGGASENGQALARAVVQACFNLLESFVSGLARAHVMKHPNLPVELQERLLSQKKSLRHFPKDFIFGHQEALAAS